MSTLRFKILKNYANVIIVFDPTLLIIPRIHFKKIGYGYEDKYQTNISIKMT